MGVFARRRWSRGLPARRRRQLARAGWTTILAEIDFDALDPPWIGIEHFGLERLRPGHQFAAHRYVAGFGHQITAERVDFVGHLADIVFFADRRAHVFKTGAAIGKKRAVALPHHVGAFVGIVLVGDIADDELD